LFNSEFQNLYPITCTVGTRIGYSPFFDHTCKFPLKFNSLPLIALSSTQFIIRSVLEHFE